jgi:hypothetical protein
MALKAALPQMSFKRLLSVHGLGFKSKAKLFSGKKRASITRICLIFDRLEKPLKIWLCTDKTTYRPMDPYVFGQLLDYVSLSTC